MDKNELRKSMAIRRSSLSPSFRHDADNRILSFLVNSSYYKESNDIFTYVSFKSEVGTHDIIKRALADGKNVYVPVIDKPSWTMKIAKISSMSELKKNYMGILEPEQDKIIFADSSDLDLILTPGLAFSEDGYRLGYGGGFYDKFFCQLNQHITSIALAYSIQLLDEIPHDEEDQKIDHLLTEKNFLF